MEAAGTQDSMQFIADNFKTQNSEIAIEYLSGDLCFNVGVAESHSSEVILQYYLADRIGWA